MAANNGTRPQPGGTSVRSAAAAALQLAEELARSESRRLLDLAVGVVVGQQGVEPATALESLERLAADSGTEIADLAADIVNGACGAPVVVTTPGLSPGPRAMRQAATSAEAAVDVDEVAESLLGVLHPVGARGLLVWRRTAGEGLRLVGAAGFSPLVRSQWFSIPPQWRALPQQAITGRQPLWLPDGVGEASELPGPARDAARAVLPLRDDGRFLGVVLVTWRGPQEFDGELRRLVLGTVELLGRVLSSLPHLPDPGTSLPVLASVLDLLAEPAMTLRRAPRSTGDGAESAALFVEHMNAAAHRLSSGVPRPVGRPLEHLLPLAAEDLAAMVEEAFREGAARRSPRLPLVREPGSVPMLNVRVLAVSADRCAVLWHAEGRDHSFSVLKRVGRIGSLAAFEDDTARGITRWGEQVAPLLGLPADAEPVPLEQVSGLLLAEDRHQLAHMLDTVTSRQEGASAVVRIPRPDGGVRWLRILAEPLLTHGTLTGLTGFYQDASAQHQTEAALAATFDTLGSVQEQAALRHRLALQLQQAIVPEQSDPDGLPGLQVAARYRPAAEEYRVGGDWYDVMSLPSGQVVIAVGDVAGHGIDAATGMVSLRNALRGLAVSGLEPNALMGALNEVALRTSGHPTATALCAHYDPRDRTLRWSSAGHLPPLLQSDGQTRFLDSSPNLLLGAVPDVAFDESLVTLRPGDQLLLYTDGLIERRHGSLDDALLTLRHQVGSMADGDGIEIRADLLMAAAHGDTDDDASLVLLRVE